MKAALRARALLELAGETPVVMETNGGEGVMFNRVYSAIADGIVFEKDRRKVRVLAHQRPEWSVWCVDNVRAIRAGVGDHLTVNFLDVDPYGEPWTILDAFFESKRPRPRRLVVAVNDGLRQKLRTDAWECRVVRPYLTRYGNSGIFRNYLAIARDMLAERAAKAAYEIRRWNGYYTGEKLSMTHYAAVLERISA
jgi:hypothetical protein